MPLTWSRLPDLPENLYNSVCDCRGFLIKTLNDNHDECTYAAVNSGRRTVYLVKETLIK